MIDLHVHTTASDGTLTPAEAVRLASRIGLHAIAITDHDTVLGHCEALSAGQEAGIEVIPGIEIGTLWQQGSARCSVHILGYYVNDTAPALTAFLSGIIAERNERNRNIAALMAEDGLPTDYDQMHQRFGPFIGRPHFAQILMEEGLVSSIDEAFSLYLNRGGKYFLPRKPISLKQAIHTITDAGGVPVLAHPFQYRLSEEELCTLISTCKSFGLQGLECRYSLYDAGQHAILDRLAAQYHLLRTGGSDFHGTRKPHIALGTGTGQLAVPDDFLLPLKQAAHLI